MVIEKPVLSPPSGENPISGRTDHVLEAIRKRKQAYNEILNKMLDANVSKFGCMSLAYEFIRLVC